jgi:tetratricopeptide (TPR) repeat protein
VQAARQGKQIRNARSTQARQDSTQRKQRVAEGRVQQHLTRVAKAREQYQQVSNNRRRQAALDAKNNALGGGTLSAGDDPNGVQGAVRPGLDSDGGATGGSGSGAGSGDGYDDGYGDGYHDGWHDGHGYGSHSIFWGCYSSWGWNSWGWLSGPIYCSSLWWHSWWWSGGHSYWGWWPSSYSWYGPWVPHGYYPQTTTVVIEAEPEVIYVEQAPQAVAQQAIPLGELVVPAVAATPSVQEDQARQEELNRVAHHYLTLGDEAFRAGRFSDAASHYSRAVEFAPKIGILHLVLSDALMAIGNYRWAAAELRVALELDPSLALHVVDKHTFYGDPIQFDQQLATLERYLSDHFLDEDARLLLAGNYHFGGRPAAAVDLLESPFSGAVVSTGPGAVLLEAARSIQHGTPVRQGEEN